MNRRTMVGALCVLGDLLAFVAHGQSCPAKPDLGEKVRQYTGHYENGAYGFATDLPVGLVGLDADDPDYQRGFTISLPGGAGAIWVWAEVNGANHLLLLSASKIDLAELRKRAERASSPIHSTELIGGRRAEQVSTEFVCKGSDVRYGFRSVKVIDRSGRFVYSLNWEGRKTGTALAERTLQALERSWRFIPAR